MKIIHEIRKTHGENNVTTASPLNAPRDTGIAKVFKYKRTRYNVTRVKTPSNIEYSCEINSIDWCNLLPLCPFSSLVFLK